jgi:hypothetical protein
MFTWLLQREGISHYNCLLVVVPRSSPGLDNPYLVYRIPDDGKSPENPVILSGNYRFGTV